MVLRGVRPGGVLELELLPTALAYRVGRGGSAMLWILLLFMLGFLAALCVSDSTRGLS